MKTTSVASLALLMALTVGASHVAGAIQRGKSAEGFEYVSGGVIDSELRALHAGRAKYNVWLTTAALGSGAHLAGVRVRIFDSQSKKTVMDQTMAGPRLFADLPLGRYEVEATFRAAGASGAQRETKVTTINKGDHHQVILNFESRATLPPDYESPFKGSPYDGEK
jgi:hypothetical protein